MDSGKGTRDIVIFSVGLMCFCCHGQHACNLILLAWKSSSTADGHFLNTRARRFGSLSWLATKLACNQDRGLLFAWTNVFLFLSRN